MKIKGYVGSDARRVLCGMATDRSVAARIAGQWTREGLFASRWENLIGRWCVEHLQKHGVPIGNHLESVFERWAEKRGDGDKEVEMVERFLRWLSDEEERSEPLASDYLLDMAGRHFNSVRLRRLTEAVEADLDAGRVEEAEERLEESRRVELGDGAVIVPGKDFEAWVDAVSPETTGALIEWPGAIGRFVRDEFRRDAFVSFTGAFGRGKSWWLLETAFQAVRQKRRVIFFEVGDMSRRQVLLRMAQRVTRSPKDDCEVSYPVRYDDFEAGPTIRQRRMKALDARIAFARWRRMDAVGRFRLAVHGSGTVSAEQLLAEVRSAERGGWVPDVVAIDYVDLLAPPRGVELKRDQVDETWRTLRRLSQEFHCCVVTATQGDAASYRAGLIRSGNFSDSRTKNDHVTAGLGLNQTETEKDQGVTRINWLKRRDDAFSESWQVAAAGCLAIGCPLILSCRV